MKLRTPISAWRTTFFATLGLTPLVACSSSDVGNGTNPGSNSGGAATGGGTSTGGTSLGGSIGAGGAKATGGVGTGGVGAGGVGAGGVGAGGIGTGGIGTGGAASGGNGGSGGHPGGGLDAGPDAEDAGRLSCRNPTPRLGPDGKPTGFVDCDGGAFTHRVEKRTCATAIPRTTTCSIGDSGGGGLTTCKQDSDCTDEPHGYCGVANGPRGTSCVCQSGCTTDAECGGGSICGCGDPVGTCVGTQNCTTDADCGKGFLCIISSDGGCGYLFACQTPKDTCVSSYDCDVGSMCAFVTDHHECTHRLACGTGRPFLVAGRARVATVANVGDWASDLAPCLDGLDGAARAELATYWTRIGLMEHASIAAFARFALELLSLGAPPELLAATHAALADETAHARDAFALASGYAGTTIGPGTLSMQGALDARSLVEIVETAVLEGCFGETVAALEAAEALAQASDPAVCAALSRVVEDETRHAELAFRFVRWALEASPRPVRDTLHRRIFDLLRAEVSRAGEAPPPRCELTPPLARHGVLDDHARAVIHRTALSELSAPCLSALLAAFPSEPTAQRLRGQRYGETRSS